MNPWIMAARPKTLPAGMAPVLLGLALHLSLGGSLNVPIALITLLCTLLLASDARPGHLHVSRRGKVQRGVS